MPENPTTLELAILGLLATEAQSGYDLLNVFETTAIGNYSSSPGTIYPALRRLEKRGLVKGSVDSSRKLRPRKTFRPTADGKAALERWLRADITRDEVQRRLDELLLRFAFHSLLDARASRRFLNDLAGKIDAYVLELKAQYRNFPDGAPLHGRMALALGIEHYRAAARWARRNLPQFEEETS